MIRRPPRSTPFPTRRSSDLTGGKVISEELGVKLENTVLADLGHGKRIVIDKDNTTIIGGKGKQRSEEHTSELQSRLHLVCRLLLEKKKKKPPTPVGTSTCPG